MSHNFNFNHSISKRSNHILSKSFVILCLFSIIFVFSFQQAIMFDTYNIDPGKDYFLEFSVKKGYEYRLFIVDAFNAPAFSTDHTLEYARFALYQKDKKTYYPSKIYASSYKEGGVTTEDKEAAARFYAIDDVVYLYIRGTFMKSAGTFGVALLDSKNVKITPKISAHIFDQLNMQAMKKYNLKSYYLKENIALSFEFKVKKGERYSLFLVDSYNNEIFGTYCTLEGLWFHVFDEHDLLYESIYTSEAEDGGITPLEFKPAAVFDARSDTVNILIEPISLIYEGSFAMKLESKGEVLEPVSMKEAKPIVYENTVEENLEKKNIKLDSIEIVDKEQILIKVNLIMNKKYKVFLADKYNSEVYDADFTFQDLFFQIFENGTTFIPDIYTSEISIKDNIGGITISTDEPAAEFVATSNTVIIKISSYSGCKNGTIGFLIMDENNNIISYEVLK